MTEVLLFCLQGIPEVSGIIACSLALARVKLRWGLILVFAGVLVMVTYMIRHMPVTFGLHTVAGILLIVLFIVLFTRVPPSTSFIVVFITYAVLALLEVSVYELFGRLLNIESSYFVFNPYTRMLIGLPHSLIMIVIALVIPRYRRSLEGMWKI